MRCYSAPGDCTCRDGRARQARSRAALLISLLVAPQAAALAFKTLAAPRRRSTRCDRACTAARNAQSHAGSVRRHSHPVSASAPLAAITLAVGLRAFLLEASSRLRSLTAHHPMLALRRIVRLPLLRPHLLVMAALLVFVAGVGNFGIPALVGYRRIT